MKNTFYVLNTLQNRGQRAAAAASRVPGGVGCVAAVRVG